MKSVLASLYGVPFWVVAAGMGAVFGILGTLIGYSLERYAGFKAQRIAVIVAIVVSLQISNQIMKPAIQDAHLNRDLPVMVDEFTRLDSAKITLKGMEYNYTLMPTVPEDFDVSIVKTTNLRELCSNWLPDFSAKRATQIDYRYHRVGGTAMFSLTPDDCSGI